MPLCWKKKTRGGSISNSMRVLAAQTLKIANMNGIAELDRLETELEDEINWESRTPPREFIARARQKVDRFLHTKAILLMVVVLNVLDCLLVLGEITIDFHYTSRSEQLVENASSMFLHEMAASHPIVSDHWSVYNLYDHLIHATLLAWDNAGAEQTCASLNSSNISTPLHDNPPVIRHRRAAKPVGKKDFSELWLTEDYDSSMRTMYEVAHALHLASISILSVLVAETIIKILATVPRFFRSKLQVFDAVVVFISFILDLVFIEGLLLMEPDTFVWVITLLLPWRIIRVLNSLVVAVMDKQRFHLKIMYQQKKKLDKSLQEANSKSMSLSKQLEVLKNLCKAKGILEWEVAKALGDHLPRKSESGGGLAALGKLAVNAMGAFTPVPRPHTPTPVWPDPPAKSGPLRRRQSLSTPNLFLDPRNLPVSPQGSFLDPSQEVDSSSQPSLSQLPPPPLNLDLPPAPTAEASPDDPPNRHLRLYIPSSSTLAQSDSEEPSLVLDGKSSPTVKAPSVSWGLINEHTSVSRL